MVQLTLQCQIDTDVDRSGSMRCEVLERGRKIGDFNIAFDEEKGTFEMGVKGKELLRIGR